MANGGNIVVRAITMTIPAYVSFVNISLTLPNSAKINPTSPRGIMAIPMMIRATHGSLRNRAPTCFPTMATKNSDKEKVQINGELQSTSCRFNDRPTMTKKIGVNKKMIGFICASIRSANVGSLWSATPNGRKNRRDSASHAAKPPATLVLPPHGLTTQKTARETPRRLESVLQS